MTMRIASGLLARILAEARATPAVEVCGLLFGDGDAIADARPGANVAADPARHFEVDPRLLFAALRAERAGGPRLIGHYHSHPGGRAEPSPRDAADAAPGSLWLIVAENRAGLFRFGGGGFAAVPLIDGL